MTIEEIDFAQLYRDHMIAAGGRRKSAEEWDRRANVFNGLITSKNHYASEFVARVKCDDCTTLLDVGCGPGTIAIALAPRMARVYGLDYSRKMLAHLEATASARGFRHVLPIHRAWEDDWSDVPDCDLVVASRSTAVMDLSAALTKLDSKARRRVCLSSPVGDRVIPLDIYQILGRTPPPRPQKPDYIYVPNLLYGMGRRPSIDYIANDNYVIDPKNIETLVRTVSLLLGELNLDEKQRLAQWLQSAPEARRRVKIGPSHWAVITWDTDR